MVPVPIIVGCGRSGTTLLRFMLDSHPELAIPPETGFLKLAPETFTTAENPRELFIATITQFPPDSPAWNDFGIPLETFAAAIQKLDPFTPAEGFRTFFRLYAKKQGKARWGDKTPAHVLNMGTIARTLPETKFVHIIRDGRDVALSLRNVWFCPSRDIRHLAAMWRDHVMTARYAGLGPDRYREIQFEQLVVNPEKELRDLCEFLDLRYDPAMLDYHRHARARLEEHRSRYTPTGELVVSHEQRVHQQRRTLTSPDASRLGVWRQEMSESEVLEFESVAGELLQELGYPLSQPIGRAA